MSNDIGRGIPQTHEPSWHEPPWAWAITVGCLAAIIYMLSIADPTPFNHYVLLADALLHGRIELIDPPTYLEIARVGTREYVIPPPGPALLLLPYVALRGTEASQSLASAMIGGVAAGLGVLLAARIARTPRDLFWLGILPAFGTILWFMSAIGSTWYFAHVVAMAGLTLSVWEALGRRRPALIGAGVAIAYLSHQPTILTAPFFLFATLDAWAPGGLRAWRRIDVGYLIRLTGPMALAVAGNSAYNFARFGTVADVANVYRPNIFNEPWFDRGLFHWSYIPRHLRVIFLDWPRPAATPPYLPVPWTGLALWVTTPAFIYALRAPLGRETLAAWLSIGLVGLAVTTFGATGITQFGYRLATDFYPLLYLLTFRGMRGSPGLFARGLIILSVLANAWGVLFWRMGWIAR